VSGGIRELENNPDGQKLEIMSRGGAVVFQVRVQPRASRDEITGVVDGALKVRLRAPALEDRANAALCEYLAELLKTPKSAVRILSGRTQPHQTRGNSRNTRAANTGALDARSIEASDDF
jgi:uncharacterized protein (TIGR00251 family)